jgi:lysophospholipid acyltransferase (LPLAT)-like uncharacterized protein
MAAGDTPPREKRQRTWQRRVRKELARALMKIGVYTVPYLYVAYMWLVYKTSRVEELGYRPDLVRAERGGGVFAVWHDEVFFVAWAFGKFRADTLASQGDSGEIITRMLRLCGFNVFRGGSSSARSRRRSTAVVQEMIEHMKSHPGVLYGITTDGSKGPVYRMKQGVVTLAVSGGSELFVEKTWCRRYFQLPTWDRSLVPLPFNHIVHVYAGPVTPPPDAAEVPERFEALAREVERLLCRVSAYARRLAEGEPPDAWIDLFPEEHRAAMRDPTPPELFRCERPRSP